MEPMQDAWIELNGTVQAVTFQNPQNGYTVLQLTAQERLITAVGSMPGAAAGDHVTLRGRFVTHKTYGEQFEVHAMEIVRPQTADAILTYLSSGAVKGIGPATAAKIVDLFGENTLEVLEKEPDRLAQIKGISLRKAREIGALFAAQFGMRALMLRFSSFGFTPVESLRIMKELGAGAVERVEANPYLLCEPKVGFSFDRADALATALGVLPDADDRVESGVLHVLRHNSANGHTCLPEDKVCQVAARMLDVNEDAAYMAVERLCEAKRMMRAMRGKTAFLALPSLFDDESYIAGRMRMMLQFPPASIVALPERIDAIESANGIHYADRQREAITQALSAGVLVLTGGPGTGKTTTIKAIITLLEQQNMEILLTAPTGRAAKRMTDLTGREAKTMHRLLEATRDERDRSVFARNEQNPLAADAIIVDELSMVDVTLFAALLKAMRLGCRLIMVGDENQLPAVGAGNVLGDIIASAVVPVVRLTEIFRQALESRIITNAHRIVQGQLPEPGDRNGDYFVVHEGNPVRAARMLTELCTARLPAAYGLDPLQDIQLLCPSRVGETGSVRMNALLSETLNPPAFGKQELVNKRCRLREGDKVMQVRNNYDIVWTGRDGQQGSGVFNGDIGTLISIDRVSGTLSVRFDDRTAIYSAMDADDLDQAYAITVHKSQGSEYECVVIPTVGIPEKLRYRNLLYTGVTRAKRLLVLVGTDEAVARMVHNHVKSLRYTMLTQLLTQP